MPDPISPTGSLGQLPPVAQTQTTYAPVSGAATPEAGRAQFAEKSEKAATEQDIVRLGMAEKKTEKEKDKEKEKAIPTLEDATKTLKEYLKNLPSDLQFKKDEETGTVMFKVVNPLTKEVIREFPPEEVVEMSKRLRKMGQQNQKSGILFDEKS